MKKTKYLIPVAVIATGIFFGIYTYTHYTLFKPSQGPGDGFLPFILSVLLGFLIFANATKEKQEPLRKKTG